MGASSLSLCLSTSCKRSADVSPPRSRSVPGGVRVRRLLHRRDVVGLAPAPRAAARLRVAVPDTVRPVAGGHAVPLRAVDVGAAAAAADLRVPPSARVVRRGAHPLRLRPSRPSPLPSRRRRGAVRPVRSPSPSSLALDAAFRRPLVLLVLRARSARPLSPAALQAVHALPLRGARCAHADVPAGAVDEPPARGASARPAPQQRAQQRRLDDGAVEVAASVEPVGRQS